MENVDPILQKFPIVAELGATLSGTRFAVVVDEAHSSQSGEAVKDLKAVLSGQTGDAALAAAEKADAQNEAGTNDAQDELADLLEKSVAARGKQGNLSFFAFTATPKHRTLMLFGEKPADPDGPNRPFHLYSMRQAIEEGFILDVLANYTTYKTYYRLANGLGGEDPELPKGKAASALARWVSLHPTNIDDERHADAGTDCRDARRIRPAVPAADDRALPGTRSRWPTPNSRRAATPPPWLWRSRSRPVRPPRSPRCSNC